MNLKDEKKYPDLRIAVGQPFPGLILNYPMSESAPATIYYDDATKLYYWRIETPGGRKKPFEVKLTGPKSLHVKLEFPGSVSIISIEVTEDGQWHERMDLWTGQKDGWFKMQQTVLKKVK